MYTIQKAKITDLPQLEKIYAGAREKMRAAGNPNQWGNNYPPTELITKDILLGRNYIVLDNDHIAGTFVMPPFTVWHRWTAIMVSLQQYWNT